MAGSQKAGLRLFPPGGAICVSLILTVSLAFAEPAGPARVIDGDTIEIHGARIRLAGIDAPERGQWCSAAQQRYRCGLEAGAALGQRIGGGIVRCVVRGIDHYRRDVATCYSGGENINAWLVRSGHAVADRQYSREYVGDEAEARRERRGLWRGEFDLPRDWRRTRHERSRPSRRLATRIPQVTPRI